MRFESFNEPSIIMRYRITAPSGFHTVIDLPSSKSISNRALILHALSQGKYQPENLSDCNDTQAMLKALEEKSAYIDIHASGTAMRFLTAYLSLKPGIWEITGTERMQQRPIKILVEALRELGAKIEYIGNEGFPPLRICGTLLQGTNITLSGNVSSQYISALLMIAPILRNGLTLHLTGEIISRPYINLTLQLMKDFGAKVSWQSEDCIKVYSGEYRRDVQLRVESDWSAASYWYQMTALSNADASVQLNGLHPNSYQGDSRGAKVFEKLGVYTEFNTNGAKLIKKATNISRIDEDFIDIPDLAQTFVVTCALLDIPFRFTGLQTLKIKETDRIDALICELRKIGYVLRSEQDSILIWDGERCEQEKAPVISTYEDHRMAMAFAPASFIVPEIMIAEPSVVSKSYPNYWNDLQHAGFSITEE